jgi:hypothetical protein
MPILQELLPGESKRSPSLASTLLRAVSLLGDVLGWVFNEAFLPVLHEQLYTITLALEHLVGVAPPPSRVSCLTPTTAYQSFILPSRPVSQEAGTPFVYDWSFSKNSFSAQPDKTEEVGENFVVRKVGRVCT